MVKLYVKKVKVVINPPTSVMTLNSENSLFQLESHFLEVKFAPTTEALIFTKKKSFKVKFYRG